MNSKNSNIKLYIMNILNTNVLPNVQFLSNKIRSYNLPNVITKDTNNLKNLKAVDAIKDGASVALSKAVFDIQEEK